MSDYSSPHVQSQLKQLIESDRKEMQVFFLKEDL